MASPARTQAGSSANEDWQSIMHNKRLKDFLYWCALIGIGLTSLLAGLIACQSKTPAPTWHHIIPGTSTDTDVLRELGEPAYKFEDGQKHYTAYSYGPSKSVYMVDYMVIFEAGIVKLIQVHDISNTTDEILKRYGEPEKITWPVYEDPCWKRLFIYARQGVAFVAQNQSLKGSTVERFYFEPQSVHDFLAAFAGNVLPDHNTCLQDTYPEDYLKR